MKHQRLIILAALLLPVGLFAANAPAPEPVTLHVGDPAPALTTGKWLKGEPVSAFETGKVYVLEFWATWCGPCRRSIPHMTKLQKKYPQAVFIGQNCSDTETEAKWLVRQMGDKMGYRVALDDISREPKGAMQKNWLSASGARGIPAAFVVDKAGKLAWTGHPLALERVVALCLAGTYNPKTEAECQTKMGELRKTLTQAMQGKNADEALTIIDKMNELDPYDTAEREFQKASLLLTMKKDYKSSQELLGRLVDHEWDNDAPALTRIATLVLEAEDHNQRDLDLALRAAKRAVETGRKNDSAALSFLARVYAANGQYNEAVETQAKVVYVTSSPPNSKAQTLLNEYREKAKGQP